jgi:hypothetical protein
MWKDDRKRIRHYSIIILAYADQLKNAEHMYLLM